MSKNQMPTKKEILLTQPSELAKDDKYIDIKADEYCVMSQLKRRKYKNSFYFYLNVCANRDMRAMQENKIFNSTVSMLFSDGQKIQVEL